MVNTFILPIILSIIATIITNISSELFKEYRQYKKDYRLAKVLEQIINTCDNKKELRRMLIDEYGLCKLHVSEFEIAKKRLDAREFYLDASYVDSFISKINSTNQKEHEVAKYVNQLAPCLRKLESNKNIGPLFDLKNTINCKRTKSL